MEKRNSQCEHGQPMEQTRSLFCLCALSITTSVSHLANKFDVRSELHGQVSLADVNQIEAMNGFKNLKIHLTCLKIAFFENVNIKSYWNNETKLRFDLYLL